MDTGLLDALVAAAALWLIALAIAAYEIMERRRR